MRRYSDAQLSAAVSGSRSWRGVLRTLGFASASSIRSVRRHADRLGLDYSHFTGQRRWTDAELAAAVAASTTWSGVAELLELAGGSYTNTLRGHAVRLGLDFEHFAAPQPTPTQGPVPGLANLRRAGSLMAAAWFELCGYSVCWPLEPCRFDLLVSKSGATARIQVKTTTVKAGGSWKVTLLSTAGSQPAPYGVDEIDSFFVIDGDLNYFLIPIEVVGGLTGIHLAAYAPYRLTREIA